MIPKYTTQANRVNPYFSYFSKQVRVLREIIAFFKLQDKKKESLNVTLNSPIKLPLELTNSFLFNNKDKSLFIELEGVAINVQFIAKFVYLDDCDCLLIICFDKTVYEIQKEDINRVFNHDNAVILPFKIWLRVRQLLTTK